MFLIFSYSLLVMLASLSGVFFLWRGMGNFLERHLSLLVSFSAGVFFVIAYELSEETLLHARTPWEGLLWVFLGATLLWLIFKFLPTFHHHHGEADKDCHYRGLDARRILWADALHNIGDGILLATSLMISPLFGFFTALSIFVHEFVQEVSEFFVLRQSGYSSVKALGLNFLVSGTILIGALGSFFLLQAFEILEVPLFGLAAGSFIVVVLQDLIPHSVRHSHNEKMYVRHILWFLIGLLLMMGVNSLVSHSHEHHQESDGLEHLAHDTIS